MTTMKCNEADNLIHPYIDGELAEGERDSYERHLLDCPACNQASRLQSRFKSAVRGHLGPRLVSARLQARIAQGLAAPTAASRPWFWERFPRLGPAVMAAGALAALVLVARSKTPVVMEQARRTLQAGVPLDVVDSSCLAVANWFRGKLDFPVKPPAQTKGASCQGGRLVNVGGRFGAYLVLTGAGGQRLGLMIYDDDADEESTLRRMLVGRELTMVTDRGASTAAFRGGDGLNYVMTVDADEDWLASYLTTTFRP